MNKTINRRLMCDLTPMELVEHSKELARTLTKMSELEIEKARLNEKTKPLKVRVQELVPIVDSKQIKKEVECLWVNNWDAGTRSLYRQDTQEFVEDENIPEHEKQERLI